MDGRVAGRKGLPQKDTRELLGVMEMFCVMNIVVVVTGPYTFVKTYQIVHLKLVNFIVYKLYSLKLFEKRE